MRLSAWKNWPFITNRPCLKAYRRKTGSTQRFQTFPEGRAVTFWTVWIVEPYTGCTWWRQTTLETVPNPAKSGFVLSPQTSKSVPHDWRDLCANETCSTSTQGYADQYSCKGYRHMVIHWYRTRLVLQFSWRAFLRKYTVFCQKDASMVLNEQ